jgi:general secretion pathway protein I
MIALAIVAIALAAASRAVGVSSSSASEIRFRILADCVAGNRMAALAVVRAWPGIGVTEGTEQQGGVEFYWRTEVLATPHPELRRVEIRVTHPEDPSRELRRLVGVLARER